jgi:hypothetical protein
VPRIQKGMRHFSSRKPLPEHRIHFEGGNWTCLVHGTSFPEHPHKDLGQRCDIARLAICPDCKAPTAFATGIGPYCTNRLGCGRLDDLIGPRMQPLPEARKQRYMVPEHAKLPSSPGVPRGA